MRRPELDGKFYEAGRALNNDAGIRIQDCRDILVERNYIHDPRGTANSWFYSHPAGPNGIFVGGTEQAVFRYNDFIGSDRHRWNDAVEGMNNGSVNGSVCRDAEIVGNYFAFGNDDGMELDGGQQNCRFLFNKSEGVLCGVSTAPCLAGPSYLVGNLFCKPGDELGFTNTAIKNNYSVAGRGKLYFLHNTMVGDWSAMSSYGGKKEENEALKRIFKGYGRNNLAAVSGSLAVVGIFRAIADFDYDLLLTNQKGLIGTLQRQYNQERHGIAKPPVFVDAARGNYTLAAGSPGIGAGEPVPGLTTGARSAFGRRASLRPAVPPGARSTSTQRGSNSQRFRRNLPKSRSRSPTRLSVPNSGSCATRRAASSGSLLKPERWLTANRSS